MDKTTFFPMYVDMKDRKILIIGGGTIAARRAGVLLDFEADVTVLSPAFCQEMTDLTLRTEQLHLMEGLFEEQGELIMEKERFFFVLAATNQPEVNRDVVRVCHEIGIPVNTADDAGGCDFYFPAIIRKDDLVIGVASAGKSHKKVRRIAQKIRELEE